STKRALMTEPDSSGCSVIQVCVSPASAPGPVRPPVRGSDGGRLLGGRLCGGGRLCSGGRLRGGGEAARPLAAPPGAPRSLRTVPPGALRTVCDGAFDCGVSVRGRIIVRSAAGAADPSGAAGRVDGRNAVASPAPAGGRVVRTGRTCTWSLSRR